MATGFEFYPSLTHDTLNGIDFKPCAINGRIMLNPKYPAYEFDLTALAISDSGAFQEIAERLKAVEALRRQLRFRHNIRIRRNAPHWNFEALCIYDQMGGVDEKIIVVNGRKKKIKQRGTYETAQIAIAQTLEAAYIYAINRKHIQCPIMFIGQGINPDQYIDECLKPMLQYIQPGDYFGFGGFCIIGKVPSLKPVFYETFARALPILLDHGIERVHILGVCVVDAIQEAMKIARPYTTLAISSDSASPETNGARFGKGFVDGKWQPLFENSSAKWIRYHPGQLALENIAAYVKWTKTL